MDRPGAMVARKCYGESTSPSCIKMLSPRKLRQAKALAADAKERFSRYRGELAPHFFELIETPAEEWSEADLDFFDDIFSANLERSIDDDIDSGCDFLRNALRYLEEPDPLRSEILAFFKYPSEPNKSPIPNLRALVAKVKRRLQ